MNEVPAVETLINCNNEQEVWSQICAHKQAVNQVNHQLLPVPMGLLSSIFADDNDGPINKETLYTLCVLVLDIVRETEDLKSSKYIKALISFLVFPTHLKEKQYNPIKYSGFILKPASETGKRYKDSIQLMIQDIEKTISAISNSTSKTVKEPDEIESVTSTEMKEAEGNSIKAESTSEMIREDDTGLASCLINLDFDKGPNVPRKGEPVILDDIESEDSSQDIESDEEDLRSGKRKTSIDRRSTKRAKSDKTSTGRVYKAPPQILQVPSANQNQFSCMDLVKALGTTKTMFMKLSSQNAKYLTYRNKGTNDKIPPNIGPALQEILEQSRSKADLPGELRAAMRDKCLDLGIAFNLAPLDEKLCERLMEPAKSHDEAMITDLKDISGYSFTGFVCRGMNYITANGQKVGKPETTNQLLDMVGHTWAYQHLERKKSALTAKYLGLYEGLRNNEHQLRKYFERGGAAFGDHITMLIHNLTTSYLSSAYDGIRFEPSIHLAFQSEIVQKITLNTYPDIQKKNGRNNDYQGGRNYDRYSGNNDRYNNRSHRGGYHGSQNDNRSESNNRNQPKSAQRGSGKGPFIYTGKRGQLNKYLGKDAIANMGDNIPRDSDNNKICFNGLTYEKCNFAGCRFSHKIKDNIDKIDTWMKSNNLPFKKRE